MTPTRIKTQASVQVSELWKCGCPTLPGAPVAAFEAEMDLTLRGNLSPDATQFINYSVDCTLDGQQARDLLPPYAAVEAWIPGLASITCEGYEDEDEGPTKYGYLLLPRVDHGALTFDGNKCKHLVSRLSPVPWNTHLFMTMTPYEWETPDLNFDYSRS